MKIGILTQPLKYNYGGLLQNYALQQVLMSLGLEVETIDHGPLKVSWLRRILSRVKDTTLNFLAHKQYVPTRYVPNAEEYEVILRNTNYFIKKYISRTQPLVTIKEFNKIATSGKYGAYVVGSDQCWRPLYNGLLQPEMFLRFAEKQKGVKRVAYAASFGVEKWEFTNKMTEVCSRLAKKFDLITVREKSGVALCREHLGVNATCVLDPTMLLSKGDYESLAHSEKEPNSPGDFFYYILDPSKDKKAMISAIAKENGLTPFSVLPKSQAENRTKEDIKTRIEDCVYPSVTSWIRAFMDAKMVVVDSFHGAVFSIIFNKPFWVVGNEDRGNTRFESLLGTFGLEDRMILPTVDVDYGKEIDWGKVNEIMRKEQARCIELLSNTLKK